MKIRGLDKYYILLICVFMLFLGGVMSIITVVDPLQEIIGRIAIVMLHILCILILRLNWKKYTTRIHYLIILYPFDYIFSVLC